VRELAIAGAKHLTAASPDESKRQALLEELANNFRAPETAPWDRDALRNGKFGAWPIR
jgi:hypothetical protein